MYQDNKTTIMGVLSQRGMSEYQITVQTQKVSIVTHKIQVGHSTSRRDVSDGVLGVARGCCFIGADYRTSAMKKLA
jgi:hypothetical protein